MITTNNREIARLAWNLRDHAFSHERHFWHKYVGLQLPHDEPAGGGGAGAGGAVGKLCGGAAAQRPPLHEPARRPARHYHPARGTWAKNVYWMYGILVDEHAYGMNRDQLRRRWPTHGIETRTFFIPMHCQPFTGKRSRVSATPWPSSSAAMASTCPPPPPSARRDRVHRGRASRGLPRTLTQNKRQTQRRRDAEAQRARIWERGPLARCRGNESRAIYRASSALIPFVLRSTFYVLPSASLRLCVCRSFCVLRSAFCVL